MRNRTANRTVNKKYILIKVTSVAIPKGKVKLIWNTFSPVTRRPGENLPGVQPEQSQDKPWERNWCCPSCRLAACTLLCWAKQVEMVMPNFWPCQIEHTGGKQHWLSTKYSLRRGLELLQEQNKSRKQEINLTVERERAWSKSSHYLVDRILDRPRQQESNCLSENPGCRYLTISVDRWPWLYKRIFCDPSIGIFMKQNGKCPNLHTIWHMSQGEDLACGSLEAKQNKPKID